MKCIRVGSRESKLAVIQAEIAIAAIRQGDPETAVQLVTMKTTGDKILDRTLDKVGGKGLFVKELDAALLEKRVDVTVHSGKDLPMDIDPKLPLVAFSRRADPRDVLVLPEGVTELDKSRPIGCASRRRAVQLAALFPEMDIQPVRGNVQTRLRKLDEGQYSALVLAAAGLERLGLTHRISRYFTTDEMIPAAGQGILAAQMRAGEDSGFLSAFADRDGTDCMLAERAFVKELDGGCSSPVAAYATVAWETIHLTGMDVDEHDRPIIGQIEGPRTEGEALGRALAQQIRRREV